MDSPKTVTDIDVSIKTIPIIKHLWFYRIRKCVPLLRKKDLGGNFSFLNSNSYPVTHRRTDILTKLNDD